MKKSHATVHLKGQQHEIIEACFFHESIVYCPQSHTLKYFQKYFCFRGDIYEKYFQFPDNDTQKSRKQFLDDPIFLPSNHNPMNVQIVHCSFFYIYSVLKLLQLAKIKKFFFLQNPPYGYYPEIGQVPGIITWKLQNLWIMIL